VLCFIFLWLFDERSVGLIVCLCECCQAQSVCRRIDRVTVKGSNQPLDLYTVDIYTVPPSFGCTCEDPLHFLDADFSTDPFVAQSQLNEPEGQIAQKARLSC
jgi:hypothetical protein